MGTVSCSGTVVFQLNACVCTNSTDEGLIGADKACVLTQTRLTFQFFVIDSAEFRLWFIFDQYVGKTHLVSPGKNQ